MNEVETIQHQIADLHGKLVAARRKAPPEPVKDYEFKTPDGAPVTLSALFNGKPELILIHNMGKKCPYCTLWADGLSGVAEHLASRAAFVLTSPDSPQTLKEFAEGRRWRFRTASIQGTSFAKDMGYESAAGKFQPGVSVFRKEPSGQIVRTARDTFGPGDPYCSVWHLFNLLPSGADGWQPKYTYQA
jgi:predicted dithiol-disulfide oxidoreductase (DUF899 family)